MSDYAAAADKLFGKPKVPSLDKTGLSLSQGVKHQPATFIKDRNTAQILGSDVSFVQQRKAEAERMARLRELDLQKLQAESPKTNKWLAKPDNAAMAHDDVENLSAFEHTINAIGASVDRTQSGLENTLADVLEFSNYALSPIVDMPHTFSDNLRAMAKENMDAVKNVDASRQNLPYLGRMALAGIESVAPSLGAAATTFLTRSPAAGMATFALPVFGNEKQKGIDQGMSQGDAALHGAAQGLLEGATEMLGVTKLLGAVKDKSGFVKTIGNFVGAQLYGEEINTIAGNFESWAMLPENKDKSFMDYAEAQPSAMIDTFWQTLFGAGATGGIVHGTSKAINYGADKIVDHMQKKAAKLHQDMQKAGQAMQDKASLDRSIEILTTQSKLHKLSPDDAKGFVKEMVGDKTVSLSSDDAATFFQEHEDALYLLRDVSPDAYHSYERSQMDGSDMVMPMDEYIGNMHEYHAWLSDKLHINDNEMNAQDAESLGKEFEARLQDETNKVLEGATDAFAQSANEVRDTLVEKLVATKRFTKDTAQVNAALFGNMVASTAKEMNILPHEFMQQFPLRVSNGGEISFINPSKQDTSGLDALVHKVRANKVPTDSQVHGSSLLEFLHSKGGLQDQSGELSTRDMPKKYIKKQGNNLDEAARLAEEAGYLDERDINKLLEALDSELAGEPVRSPHEYDAALHDEQRALEDVQKAIGDKDISQLSNADIKQLVYGDFQQFIGAHAKTWNKSAADKAMEMEKDGADRNAIWDATGTFRGVDGKWRQEITDKGYNLVGYLMEGAIAEGTSGELIKHDKLYDAYPDLANIKTEYGGKGGSLSTDSFTGEHKLKFSGDKEKAIALHEMQHAIQRREGFAKGGLPKQFERTKLEVARHNLASIVLSSIDDKASIEDVLKDVKDEYLKRPIDDNTYSHEEFSAALELISSNNPDKLLKSWSLESKNPIDSFNKYKRLAGEVEARNVQTRAHLNSRARKFLRPWESQDVHDNKQIVDMGNSSSQQAKEYGISEEEAKKQYEAVITKYKGTEQWMKAPNGKDTNLNERQWVQTRTSAFKSWFGDWENAPDKASKVVDKNGDPMVVYHGTNKKFEAFDKLKFNSVESRGDYVGEGFYFTDDKMTADKYARQSGGSDIIQAFINIKTPFTPKDDFFDSMSDDELESYFESSPSEIRKEKEMQGYDGLIDHKYGQVATFNPNQIKSATGNTGQFDSANDNILYQKDGLPIEDIYGEQIQVDGQWFHADRVFHLDINKLSIGDRVSLNSSNNHSKTYSNGEVEHKISSDLFQESGANISHNDKTISKYEAAMREYGGWGDFPPITGVMQMIDEYDVKNQDELSFSRPLDKSDIGKKFVQIDNGHNRAYAAERLGIKIKFIDPSELIDKKNNNLYQKDDVQDLYVSHNLSQDALSHANDLGGLPVPSLAVNRIGTGALNSFGDISLVADKSMIDNRNAKTFNADVYSPRYPNVERVLNTERYAKVFNPMNEEAAKYGLSEVDQYSIKTDRLNSIEDSTVIKLSFLNSLGKAPAIKTKKDKIARNMVKFVGIPPFELSNNKTFIAILEKEHQKILSTLRERIEKTPESFGGKRAASLIESYGEHVSLREIETQAYKISHTILEPKPDSYENEQKIRSLFNKLSINNKKEYKKFVKSAVNRVTDSERIPDGETRNYKRKYLPHSLDNVVKIMKRNLRDGEGFHFGVPSIRATMARQFKSIDSIKASREDIISSSDFASIKEEVNDEYEKLSGLASPYIEAADGTSFDESLKDIAIKGVSSIEKNYPDLPVSIRDDLISFMYKLRNMPTEYFETKMQRSVDLSEFVGAAVPTGASKESLDILKSKGIKVVRYKAGDDKSREDAIEKIALRNKALFQNESSPRGFINFGEGVANNENVITLLENANLSTFIHETAHLFFEIRAHLATQAGASEQLKQDVNSLLKWGNIGSLEQWHSMSRDEQRALHEQVARGFEAYLMEGKSPVAELNGVFFRLRAWMVHVYQSLKNLHVNLDDDVRLVFDRMVATNEALDAAKDAQNLSPLFASQAESGMNDADWALHMKAIEDAKHDGVDALSAKAIKDLKYLENAKNAAMKKLQREGKNARLAVKQEVSDEIMAQRVNKLRSFLAKGDVPVEVQAKGLKPMKLDAEALRDMYGDDPIRLKIPNTMKRKKDGTHPDVVAAWFGYDSGDAMVRDIADSPLAKDVIEEETERRVMERYGDMYTPEQIEKAAMEQVHSTSMRRVIAQELNALDKLAGRKPVATNVVRDYARQVIARLNVHESSQSSKYLRAERKAAKATQAALKKSDAAEAAKQKQVQLFQQYLYSESEKAGKDKVRILRYLKNFNKRSVRKKLTAEYLDQVDALLLKYDLTTSVSMNEQRIKELAQQGSLHKWIAAETEKTGMKPRIRDSILRRASKVSYKSISMEELRGLYDAVKTIDNFGRNKKKLMTLAKKEDLNQAVHDMSASLIEHNKQSDIPEVYTATFKQAFSRKASTMGASLLSMEAVFRRLDGDQLGSLWQTMFKPLSDASDRAFSRKARVAKDFRELVESLYSYKERARFSGVGAKRYEIEGIKGGLTKENIIAVAANYGSATGRQRVLNDFNEWQVKLMFKHLDERDIQLVEHMWQSFENETWADLRELEREINGEAPEKVPSLSFTVNGHTMKGGYYPIKYDPKRGDNEKKIDESQSLEDMMGGMAGHMATKQGHSQARQENTDLKLRLDLGVFGQAMDEQIQDIELRRPVIDAYRMMTHPQFAAVFKASAGTAVYDELKPWLADIAVPPAADTGMVSRVIGRMRNNTAIVAMGASVKTAALNMTGYLQSFDANDVGAARIAKHSAKFLANPLAMKKAQDMVFSLSAYMTNRANTFDRDVRAHSNQMSVAGTLTPQSSTWFYLLAATDKAVSIPTWQAAYEAEMARNGNHSEKAVDFADHIVRSTQGGGREMDLSSVQRGVKGQRELYKAFTMFYSFFNATLQRNIRNVDLLKRNGIKDVPRFIGSVFLLNILPAVIGAALATAGNEDDNKYSFKWSVMETIKFMFGQVPFVRDVAGAVANKVEGNYFPYRVSPLMSTLDYAVTYPIQIASDLIDGEADEKTLKKAMLSAGVYLGLPSRQAWRTTEHIMHSLDGESDFSPVDLLMGEPYKKH